ncbi:hypothetical protein A2841_03855 [Candidatus Kaiserbacteria bacterium RIFCSPHIGHO2_01_FULL_48_10]|uniref:Glycosyltransferase 2-like domain-containing protein n=1 Tax=Candidatus Kaiserbacteria bacterium RIFCSPHIGHO2_01_FULL_48_10 TaxID=1798476 RepID=A0A1F6C246_9BACT|nr:MAG: hypothetical protein A2841_03855 [Candidatus Kaiserbacteria bacterium RIFCSPHIGHO2_01_FULL_48_10]
MTTSLVSVIIPTYQHADELPGCLESLFSQTISPSEIIVVNDGSTDHTKEILQPYEARGVRVINQQNQGAPSARNRGFDTSTGEFVLFCDADVVLRPDALEKMLQTLEAHPKTSYAYSSFQFGFKTFTLWPFDAEKLRRMPYIHTSSLIRREYFPRFDESLKRLQDWDLFLTLLEQGHEGVWVPEILFTVKARKNGMSEWLPSFIYKIPWPVLGYTPKAVRKYRQAESIIRQKHHLGGTIDS